MSKRLLAILALTAALGMSTPVLMADHGDKGNGHQHGNKHDDDNDENPGTTKTR
jgi:Spy/CpxP family protein refolding chaperone